MTNRTIFQATVAYLRYVRQEYGLALLLAMLPILLVGVLWGELQYRMLDQDQHELLAESERFRRGETDE